MKEYRVKQLETQGLHAGEWVTAWHPTGGKLVHPFTSLEAAKDWIAHQPEWYTGYNQQVPPDLRRSVPQYRIESREVTQWEVMDQ